MEKISEQKAMDMILEYLIKNNMRIPILSLDLCEKVFPTVEKEIIYTIIKKIISEGNDIIVYDIHSIDIDDFYVFLEASPLTEIFLVNQGGFTELYKKREIIKNEENEFKKLQQKNLELQNENLEFSQTIREQEAKIRSLDFKLKKIELIKQYKWFIGLCILVGGILAELLDILIAYIRQ